MQVKITVVDGKVTDAEVTQVPWNDHKDQEINSYAVPILELGSGHRRRAPTSTWCPEPPCTSQGHLGSLQSAIDQASL